MRWLDKLKKHYQETHVVDLILYRDSKKMEKKRSGTMDLVYWTQDGKQWIRKATWWHMNGYLCWKWIGPRRPNAQRGLCNNHLLSVYMENRNWLGLVKFYRNPCSNFSSSPSHYF